MRAWIAGGIFLGVLIIAFVVFVLRITESPVPPEVSSAPAVAAITNVSATDTYHAGVHTVKGTATVPTACTTLVATSSVSTASMTIVRVDLSAPLDTGVCLDVPTAISFSVATAATSTAEIDIYANGVFATTTP